MDSSSTFLDFINRKGFVMIQDYEERMVTIYGNHGLFLQLAREHNNAKYIDLSRTNDKPGWEGWHQMDLVRHLILKEHYGKDSPFTFEELSQFFIEHYDEIAEAFNSTNFSTTQIALEALKKERAKIMWGASSA